MAAHPKHITRYADRLVLDHPESIVVLITTSVREFITLGESRWSERLDPIIELLLAHPSVPLRGCIYSNGGACALNNLARAYRARTGIPLEVKGLVLDSTPGSPELRIGHRAIMLSLQPPYWAYHITHFILWIYLGLYWLYMALPGTENPVEVVRDRLNDTRLFQPRGGRVYVYSKADQLVPWDWVESSAKEAEQKGWEVRLEEFKGSKHVAHAVVDKERYWKIVQDTLG